MYIYVLFQPPSKKIITDNAPPPFYPENKTLTAVVYFGSVARQRRRLRLFVRVDILTNALGVLLKALHLSPPLSETGDVFARPNTPPLPPSLRADGALVLKKKKPTPSPPTTSTPAETSLIAGKKGENCAAMGKRFVALKCFFAAAATPPSPPTKA